MFHVQRPLVCLACLFGLGVYVGGSWAQPILWIPWLGLALAVVAFLIHHRGRWLAVGLALLFAGLLLAQAAARPLVPPAGDYQVTGTVQGLSELRQPDGRVQARLKGVVARNEAGTAYKLPAVYWTYYAKQEEPLPMDGQQVSLQGSLYLPSGQLNPAGFNFRRYLLQQGIPMGLSGAKALQLDPPGQTQAASIWLRLRLHLGAVLDGAMGDEAALFKALLIGSREDLASTTTDAFRDAGIAHILAVSGLHVGILTAWLLMLFRWLRLHSRLQFGLVLLFLLAYCRLLDFSAPVVRAAVLSLLMLGGRLLHRRSDPLTSLAVAFVLILLMRPLDLFTIGFQLSFLAVLGIITLGDRLQHLWRQSRPGLRLFDRPVLALQATLAATAFTAPLSMTVFHQLPVMGLLLSPIACAIVGLLMPYGLLILLAGLLHMPYVAQLALPARWLSSMLIRLTELSAGLPFARLRTAAPALLLILAAYLSLLFLSRYLIIRPCHKLLLPLLLVTPVLATLALAPQQAVRYTQLNAGNADAAVIEDGHHTYVIDAGEHGGDLASYLLSRGCSIDKLFITHLHRDHVGGLEQLLARGVPIGEMVLPYGALDAQVDAASTSLLALASSKGIAASFWAAGDKLAAGRHSMQVLWPMRDRLYPGMNANHGSMVMLWQLDGVSLLTTGDLSGEYERYASQPAQVLKVAHHGSKGSSSQAFLSMVRPQVALLSISRPQLERIPAVMGRLDKLGCSIYATQDQGALILQCEQGQMRLEQYQNGGLQ